MTKLPHLLRKDLRAARPWPAMLLCLALGTLCLPVRGEWQRFDASDLTVPVLLLSFLALAALQWTLLRIDPPVGASRYIGTRPVSGVMLLLSKAIVILIAGVFPVATTPVVRLAGAGMGVHPAELVQIAVQNAGIITAGLWQLSLPMALPFRHPLLNAVPALLAVLLVYWGFFIQIAPVPSFLDHIFPLQCGVAAAACAFVLSRYLRLRPGGTWISAGVAAVGVVIFTTGDRPAPPPVTPQTPQSLPVSIRHGQLYANLRRGVGDTVLDIRQDCHLDGLPVGVFAEHLGFTSEFEVDGHDGPRTSDEIWLPPFWTVPPEIALQALTGAREAASPKDGEARSFLVARREFSGLEQHDSIRVTVRGMHHFDLFRAEWVDSIPLKDGRVWTDPKIRLEFHNVIQAAPLITMELRHELITVSPRQMGASVAQGMGEFGFFGASLEDRRLFWLQALSQSESVAPLRRHHQSNAMLSLDLSRTKLGFGNPQAQPDQGSVDPAKVVVAVFRRIKIGEAHLPFEFVDVELKVE